MGQTLIFDQNSPIKIIFWYSQLANKISIAFTSNFKILGSQKVFNFLKKMEIYSL
jgi:hypothetical protein